MYKVNNMQDALRELQSECQDFTKNGKCTGCGSCCSNILPMTEEEVGII